MVFSKCICHHMEYKANNEDQKYFLDLKTLQYLRYFQHILVLAENLNQPLGLSRIILAYNLFRRLWEGDYNACQRLCAVFVSNSKFGEESKQVKYKIQSGIEYTDNPLCVRCRWSGDNDMCTRNGVDLAKPKDMRRPVFLSLNSVS